MLLWCFRAPCLLVLSGVLAHGALYPCNADIRGINATDHITLENPFQTPTNIFSNGSGTWTWTLITKSYPVDDHNSTDLEQHLRLTIEPEADLVTEKAYLGCGAILHGISHRSRVAGQDVVGSDAVSGFCNSALAPRCQEMLLNAAKGRVFHNQFSESDSVQPDRVCDPLRNMLDFSEMSECKDEVGADWWIEPFCKHPNHSVIEFASSHSTHDSMGRLSTDAR